VKERDGRHSPAHDVFPVSITRIGGEVTDDVVVGISCHRFGRESLPLASEDLDGSRADSPVKLKGTNTQIDCVGGSGDAVGIQSMTPGGFADDILVRGID
jgi:hypothetical protein